MRKEIKTILDTVYEADYVNIPMAAEEAAEYIRAADLPRRIEELRKQMRDAAGRLEFEQAAELRDRIVALEAQFLGGGEAVSVPGPHASSRRRGK